MSDTRKCVVRWNHKEEPGDFVQYGTMIVYDEGNHPLQVTSAVVEMHDGRVLEVEPSLIKFVRVA